jgi:hypothetical protein
MRDVRRSTPFVAAVDDQAARIVAKREEAWGGARLVGVALDDATARSRSLGAAFTARVPAVPVERFDWRGAFGWAGDERGTVDVALEVSGWAVERGEVLLRFFGCAISSAFFGSVGSGAAHSGGGAIELEAEEGERGGSDSGERS